jgi:hypothetical protein
MTRTGYSCAYLRRKTKHGCPVDVEHYCSADHRCEVCKARRKTRIVDPMSCHKHCCSFKTLADFHRRPARPETEVELL